jgi:HD-like signal output (HDOD) protein
MVRLSTVDTEKLLKSLTLPPLPSVLADLRAARAAGASMAEVGKLISCDLALAAAVLKVANSPAFAGRSLNTLDEALLVLGLANLDAVVTSVALKQALPLPPILRTFWEEQARVAAIARHIAKDLRLSKPDQAYLFALFRDTGIPVLTQRFSSYINVLSRAMQEPHQFVDIELRGRSTSHTIVGYLLARTWFMPDEFSAAILHHHDFDELQDAAIPIEAAQLIAVAQVAEHILRAHLQCEADLLWPAVQAPVLELLGMSDAQLDDLREDCADRGY